MSAGSDSRRLEDGDGRVTDEPEADPFADGVLEPEELQGSARPYDQPYECASCGLGLGDDTADGLPRLRGGSHAAGRARAHGRLTLDRADQPALEARSRIPAISS